MYDRDVLRIISLSCPALSRGVVKLWRSLGIFQGRGSLGTVMVFHQDSALTQASWCFRNLESTLYSINQQSKLTHPKKNRIIKENMPLLFFNPMDSIFLLNEYWTKDLAFGWTRSEARKPGFWCTVQTNLAQYMVITYL